MLAASQSALVENDRIIIEDDNQRWATTASLPTLADYIPNIER